MRTRTRLTLVGVAASLPIIGLAGPALYDTQEEIADRCIPAVEVSNGSKLHVDKPRPEACEGLNDSDYGLILFHQNLTDDGVFDEEGNVDIGELAGSP